MDQQIFYKFMTNYRSIIHLKKVDVCHFMKNANGNVFFSKPILALKTAFPNTIFKCPFKVESLKYFLFVEYLFELFPGTYFI